jgi:hypothetical protein
MLPARDHRLARDCEIAPGGRGVEPERSPRLAGQVELVTVEVEGAQVVAAEIVDANFAPPSTEHSIVAARRTATHVVRSANATS